MHEKRRLFRTRGPSWPRGRWEGHTSANGSPCPSAHADGAPEQSPLVSRKYPGTPCSAAAQ
eukprot:scaffold301_cov243-Pinguiococcus_pyrenoidosus.AAC.42